MSETALCSSLASVQSETDAELFVFVLDMVSDLPLNFRPLPLRRPLLLLELLVKVVIFGRNRMPRVDGGRGLRAPGQLRG